MNGAGTWSIIIADDEAIIREGIRTAIAWEQLGLTVVGEAEDGEEALELALAHQVDIMLVDLSMPIMNGLTLIRHIHEQLPSCRIIIITGHDEFSYAQEAIKLEVTDYILKPVNPEHLTEVLEEVISRLENDHTQQNLMQAASKQIEKHIDLLRDRFCLDWMRGELSLDEIREQLMFLHLPQHEISAVCVLRWPELSSGETLYSQRDRQLLLFAIENIALECLGEKECIHFRDYDEYLVFLLQKQPPDHMLQHLIQSVQDYLNIQVLICCEPNKQGMEELHSVYQQAKSNINRDWKLSPLIKQAKEWVQAHYMDQQLSLEKAAKSLNVSPVYLSRLFKQETGRSFIHYLTYVRMKRAIDLLHGSDLPIHEIAQQIGYDTQHYFSTAFKKTIGLSPNQYRKSKVD
ncbi:response regulator [Paenibacillus camelliae]|uniref:response regulator n=1 Tax=Paenibacillus camelliae TaxID=512410 RepID=UPI0020421AAA|nr:response regulator [Paenibacillus camelliae]MCM3634797.1 response regulator [Paenibacillus camelliae]